MASRKLSKKGSFDIINAGLIAFIGFVLIVLLASLLVSTVKKTDMVCPDHLIDDTCYACGTGFTYLGNTTCCNTTTSPSCSGANSTDVIDYYGHAWNSTIDLHAASDLPGQFSQIIVIVIVVVGILALLAIVGYGAYRKIR